VSVIPIKCKLLGFSLACSAPRKSGQIVQVKEWRQHCECYCRYWRQQYRRFGAELQNDGGQSKSKTFILQMKSDNSHVRKNVSQLTYMEGISDYVP
jgi:hypothetical protein